MVRDFHLISRGSRVTYIDGFEGCFVLAGGAVLCNFNPKFEATARDWFALQGGASLPGDSELH